MSAPNEDLNDLATTQTEGFKVGEKKTMEEYNNLGKQISPRATNSAQMTPSSHAFLPQTRTMKP